MQALTADDLLPKEDLSWVVVPDLDLEIKISVHPMLQRMHITIDVTFKMRSPEREMRMQIQVKWVDGGEGR